MFITQAIETYDKSEDVRQAFSRVDKTVFGLQEYVFWAGIVHLVINIQSKAAVERKGQEELCRLETM